MIENFYEVQPKDGNDYYVINKGTYLYRANDGKEVEPKFFGYSKHHVMSYGSII